PRYVFNTAAGRYIVLSFLGSGAHEGTQQVVRYIEERRALFDDRHVSFFGVSIDPHDEHRGLLRTMIPGIRYFWDIDQAISKQFAAIATDQAARSLYRPFTLVLDPMQRVIANIALIPAEQHNHAL